MKKGLELAHTELHSVRVQTNLPAIQANPKTHDFVVCQVCKGNGAGLDGQQCGVCLGFKVAPRGWWLSWGHPLDLHKKPPLEDSYNINPLVDCITKDLYYWYIQFPDKCLTCALDREIPVPECIDICRLKVRPVGQKDGPIQTIDTRRDFPPDVETPYGTILLSRAMLVINYHHRLQFIFRNGNGTGTQLHHINGKPYDDRYENCCLTDIHRVIEGHKKTIKTQTSFITELYDSNVLNKDQTNKLLHGEERYGKLVDSFVGPSQRVWMYIRDMDKVVSQFKEFGEVLPSLREKIESYMI